MVGLGDKRVPTREYQFEIIAGHEDFCAGRLGCTQTEIKEREKIKRLW